MNADTAGCDSGGCWRRWHHAGRRRWRGYHGEKQHDPDDDGKHDEGEPADVSAIAADYADWLGSSDVPKLFLKAEPGAILASDRLVSLVRRWPALTEKTVKGIHFVQEDSPDEIGRAIADWLGSLA
jgi:pimeloyl-ACP methyl ester carboxylesterase